MNFCKIKKLVSNFWLSIHTLKKSFEFVYTFMKGKLKNHVTKIFILSDSTENDVGSLQL